MQQTLIIIPTYNEKENISPLISAIFTVLPEVHLLFVDDSSPDKTAEEISVFMKKYPKQIFLSSRPKKEGLGKAYLHGFQWALARAYSEIFEMDADLSHPADALPALLHSLRSGKDVVVGSRYVKGIQVVDWPTSRILLSRGAAVYVKALTGLPVKDPTAGFVGYSRKALMALDFDQISFVGYAFQIEMKFRLWKKNFLIEEIPIVFTNRAKGVSKMNGSIIWEAVFGVIYLKFISILNRL